MTINLSSFLWSIINMTSSSFEISLSYYPAIVCRCSTGHQIDSGLEEWYTMTDSSETETIETIDYWKDFRFSPDPVLNFLFKHPVLVGFFCLLPVFLLVGSSAMIELQTNETVLVSGINDIFSDLRDSIFMAFMTCVTTGTVIFSAYLLKIIPGAFASLYEDELLYTTDEDGEECLLTDEDYGKLVDNYQQRLLGVWHWVLKSGFAIIIVVMALWMLGVMSSGFNLWDGWTVYTVHGLARWVIAPIIWSYFLTGAFWIFYHTDRFRHHIFKDYQVQLALHHPDKSGGLGQLGNIWSSVFLIGMIALSPLAIVGAYGIVEFSQVATCYSAIQDNPVYEDVTDADKSVQISEVAQCFSQILSEFNLVYGRYETSPAGMTELIESRLSEDTNLSDVINRFLNSDLDRWLSEDTRYESFYNALLIYNISELFTITAFIGALIIIVVWIGTPLFQFSADLKQAWKPYENALTIKIVQRERDYFAMVTADANHEKEQSQQDSSIKELREALDASISYFNKEQVNKPTIWRLDRIPKGMLRPSILSFGITYFFGEYAADIVAFIDLFGS